MLRAAAGWRVEAGDGSYQLAVARDDLSPDAIGGRGLVLLDAVADRWGPRLADGRTVWFERRGDGGG
ncbi:ATP-binding protein [Streptomyces caniscabiei]|uniref:Histidine kinase/HSP90-like ATPase domain-containing protein n=1 Tax=Streptomyces caniscabiei TaxID=2746961 RepID=A0A927QPL5_9ACTN|nr:ATP-binding protein [Streptomyces caniscabiei]MBD9727814.1 hypothetical protein [Streptomyces caniscabiei]MDX3513512.1 hypothetical protein [Streptomyces caniscabiei]MDX3722353.1 hypothetical protein [Streptomyces caniscabiei]WEO27377.1 hypothetical protein IHE65_31820 [Streptomyces caniscabiei]